jgi:hypothetical protein
MFISLFHYHFGQKFKVGKMLQMEVHKQSKVQHSAADHKAALARPLAAFQAQTRARIHTLHFICTSLVKWQIGFI